ncbi:tRNA uridine-5-carboxymethylaminomethyl(34) synthesis enzyme MnmG [Helicobacter saguini]|uniref:tRNA uridine 5-carboxymethylaminomethyl modification enzyme MnmG n=2 Tax=Helicobacter saguini TaxID=1548018 RepID=A0A347VIN4_9HELI|nr:FAD-dependent oxidoreductase [Helicobacter saguini]MWV62769.1 tRNA uridine-5-carboxymethylaminomethyl(34) synthesis enzyme MnmG [Helicobacter saguini]MWV66561.1 tRNA uridine-5-carboxymethylaminomethyl(34) synthesis enzyme MnmG [Helicobacter saguini]MWV68911.1 tRNA uridine-5-carboxymethylaminomethyl(34) synthesis enzyme MnmG [Helicobacter saguini]MWV71535.1 tRNA uridine-5-carboxymethylaminomethyl(34) synthesis enzyme MnmG [Helicobacter saguini]TLD93632.1 tRNA uridine-5-carboxymethylaminometh
MNNYDVIVIGGGHAGLEASFITAKMGLHTLLITHLIDNIALASCNPAVGGLGKGHLVKEVDSLGGLMGAITDISGLQYRILNASKGPAVRGTRAQIDMDLYRRYARDFALHTHGLEVMQGNVVEILCEDSKDSIKQAVGVKLSIGKEIYAKKVILTSGTFLNGKVHIGTHTSNNGRIGEISSNELSENLKRLGIPLSRLKTGTCPRILGTSIESKHLQKHYGDAINASLEHEEEMNEIWEEDSNNSQNLESRENIESKNVDSKVDSNNSQNLDSNNLPPAHHPTIEKDSIESNHNENNQKDLLLRNAIEKSDFKDWQAFQNFIHKNYNETKELDSISEREYNAIINESFLKQDAPYFSLLTHHYLNYGKKNLISRYLDKRLEHGYFRPHELPCFVTYTNETTHKIIESNFHLAPLFTGQIQGTGPRYCPSIEDKINRFRDKERHQLFLEPQTYAASEYYVNGLSTSLPFEVQESVIHSIEGLQNAKITRYGYAIEYDYSQPTNLYHTLESKIISSLYFAGQINGTTGYEEAAAQGITAGINAALSILYSQGKTSRKNLIFDRSESYIGVMIDDLVTKGTNEPYRVFTSRAEYRLLLREDNACFRLLKYAKELRLLDDSIIAQLEIDKKDIESNLYILDEDYTPSMEHLSLLESIGESGFSNKCKFSQIIGRDSMNAKKLRRLDSRFSNLSTRALKQLQIYAKYKDYIVKQEAQIKRSEKNLSLKIPSDFDYKNISGLSLEVIEKLSKERPTTLKEASLISGITPASLEVLELHLCIKHHKS